MISSSQQSDQRYVEGFLEVDEKVIDEVYSQFYPGIRTMILQNSGSEEDAKDIFQESMIILHRKVSEKGFELRSAFFSFLYGIARRLWLKELKKRPAFEGTISNLSEYRDNIDIEKTIFERERTLLFREKMALLDEACRKLLQLFFEKIKMKDIAEKMGYASEAYAKKRKFHCKEKLITLVENDIRYKELI